MRLLAVIATVALLGCLPPPKQSGGLGFFDHAGLERRMRILCRLGVGDDTIQSACARPKVRPSLVVSAAPARPDPSAQAAKSTQSASESCSNCAGLGTLEPVLRLTR